jgi:hypothetical protein
MECAMMVRAAGKRDTDVVWVKYLHSNHVPKELAMIKPVAGKKVMVVA